jgi:hypothetical protein
MAAGDEKPPEGSDTKSPAPSKPDVRVGSHDDMGVHVSRDLRAQGPSARGFGSNMSKLNFSARALPRDESTAAEPASGPAAAEPDTPPDPASPLSWLTGLFSRR